MIAYANTRSPVFRVLSATLPSQSQIQLLFCLVPVSSAALTLCLQAISMHGHFNDFSMSFIVQWLPKAPVWISGLIVDIFSREGHVNDHDLETFVEFMFKELPDNPF